MSIWLGPILVESFDLYRNEVFLKKLDELESAIEKQKNDIKFYTPSVPLIGIGANDNLKVVKNLDGDGETEQLEEEEEEEGDDEINEEEDNFAESIGEDDDFFEDSAEH